MSSTSITVEIQEGQDPVIQVEDAILKLLSSGAFGEIDQRAGMYTLAELALIHVLEIKSGLRFDCVTGVNQ